MLESVLESSRNRQSKKRESLRKSERELEIVRSGMNQKKKKKGQIEISGICVWWIKSQEKKRKEKKRMDVIKKGNIIFKIRNNN